MSEAAKILHAAAAGRLLICDICGNEWGELIRTPLLSMDCEEDAKLHACMDCLWQLHEQLWDVVYPDGEPE